MHLIVIESRIETNRIDNSETIRKTTKSDRND